MEYGFSIDLSLVPPPTSCCLLSWIYSRLWLWHGRISHTQSHLIHAPPTRLNTHRQVNLGAMRPAAILSCPSAMCGRYCAAGRDITWHPHPNRNQMGFWVAMWPILVPPPPNNNQFFVLINGHNLQRFVKSEKNGCKFT